MNNLTIEYLKGDATNPIIGGNKIIVHVCNDIGGWGRGFVLALSNKWSQPESNYRRWYKSEKKFHLGQTQIVQVERDTWVGNMIAQRDTKLGSDGTPPIRYEAVGACLSEISSFALENKATVHMPRIGCGLAGGKWENIEPLIISNLIFNNVPVIVYDLE
jgi:O-acetyl-ADP-ribose deacetylase (regulator of RNase III)